MVERGGASECGGRGGAGVSGRGRVINGFMSLEDKKSKIGEETKLRSFSRSKLSSISKVYSFKVVAKRCKHCAGPVSPVCLLSKLVRHCLLGFHLI